MKTAQDNFVYDVWVGGGEVGEYYINELEEAREVAKSWRDKGYDDVVIEKLLLDERTGDIIENWWIRL